LAYALSLSDPEAPWWLTGAKASSLARLVGAGEPVPAGIVLTFDALGDAIRHAGLGDTLSEIIATCEKCELRELAGHSARIEALLTSLTLPDALEEELIGAAVPLLAEGPVSVRSSSSIEDGGSHSFAGQHDTVLGVADPTSLLAAVKSVWASLFSERALSYLRALGMSLGELRMGVVVQRLVPSAVSGVAFSIHPVTGRRDNMMISAAFGLGETTVAGEVTPDEIVVGKKDLDVTGYVVGNKGYRIDAVDGGTEQTDVDPTTRDSRALSDDQITAIGEHVLAIEAANGGNPQDIEWAIDGAAVLHILQARPLVVASDEAVADGMVWDSPIPGANWRRTWRLGEWLPFAVTPLFASWVLPRLSSAREEFGTGAFGWKDMDSFSMPRPWFCVINGYFFTRMDFPGFNKGKGGASPTATEQLERMRKSEARIRAWRERDLPAYVEHHRANAARDVQGEVASVLTGFIEQLSAEAGEFWSFIAPIGYGFEEMMFRPRYEKTVPDEARPHFSVLFAGYESRMLDAQIALHDLAGRIKQDEAAVAALARAQTLDGTLPGWLESEINSYNAEFGHQVLSLDTWWPTLGESAEHCLASLRTLVATEGIDPRETLRAAAERRETAVESVLADVPEGEDKELLVAAIAMHQGNAQVRENANFYLQAGWPLIRRCLQELGEQLVARGILTDRDQVHFLHKEELFGVLQATTDLAPVAAARQATWEQQQRLSPPMVIGDEGMMAQPGGWDEATKTLTGNGASPGVVRGRVHKIESAGDATRFTAGDILVIGAASPLLTPLMLSASALVVEIGGGASHSSLVARELGLPAVVNAREARMRFVNGDLVEVDGGAGTICVVDQGAGR